MEVRGFTEMRRFRFPLERVLAYRRRMELLAEWEEQRARQAAAAAEQGVAAAQAQLTALANAMTQAVPAADWPRRFAQSDQAAKQLEEARAALAGAERVLAEAAAARAKRAAEAEALAVLRREQWEQHRLLAAREEQARLDEWSLRRRGRQEGIPETPT